MALTQKLFSKCTGNYELSYKQLFASLFNHKGKRALQGVSIGGRIYVVCEHVSYRYYLISKNVECLTGVMDEYKSWANMSVIVIISYISEYV